MINTDFLIQNQKQLLEIYQKERFFNNYGKEGALFINFTNPEKVDVFYWTMDEMTEEFRKKLIEEMKKKIDVKNVSYFIAFDGENTNVISIKL
tara:strand:+ start:253 stop:531 length:279 start_codon:yes stop_codon:yes gene_type:complete